MDLPMDVVQKIAAKNIIPGTQIVPGEEFPEIRL
jgi:hypothetical protein